jgi:ferrous iron transport protein A
MFLRKNPVKTVPRPLQANRLLELPAGAVGIVRSVVDVASDDVIARRLRELGFTSGERVRILARGPFGGDPIVVRVRGSRFALRRAEAARILLKGSET